MRTVAVTGASGFVGRAVVRALRARGANVIALTRRRARDAFPPDVEVRRFDFGDERPDAEAFAGATDVVHLAGETIDGRWSAEKRGRIADSRVLGTARVVDSLRACTPRPATLICASAVGYYGADRDEALFETSSPGRDFLAGVVLGWEAAALRAREAGIRVVTVRTAFVLDDGGGLEKMKRPFLLGAGGPLGTGRQLMPWIHRADLAAVYCFALENESLEGPLNAAAPDYATNARFAAALGAALHRPARLPTPALALCAVLGEFAQSILGNQLVIPAALERASFTWSHPRLEPALAAIFRS